MNVETNEYSLCIASMLAMKKNHNNISNKSGLNVRLYSLIFKISMSRDIDKFGNLNTLNYKRWCQNMGNLFKSHGYWKMAVSSLIYSKDDLIDHMTELHTYFT